MSGDLWTAVAAGDVDAAHTLLQQPEGKWDLGKGLRLYSTMTRSSWTTTQPGNTRTLQVVTWHNIVNNIRLHFTCTMV